MEGPDLNYYLTWLKDQMKLTVSTINFKLHYFKAQSGDTTFVHLVSGMSRYSIWQTGIHV